MSLSAFTRRSTRHAWRCLALSIALTGCQSGSDSEELESAPAPPATAAQVVVRADRTQANSLAWGLLHGLTRSELGTANPTPLIKAVQPKSWRMANQSNDVYGYVVNDARFPAMDGTQIVWNVQDSFMMAQGGSSSARICVGAVACPTTDALRFASFADLRAAWNNFLPIFLARAPAFDWYDVFAEPDLQVIGLTVPDDLVTLYLDAETAIRGRYPQARLVAPSYGSFSGGADNRLVAFVRALKLRGGTPNAIAWHEFGAHPGQVVEHAAAARAAAACTPACPELHINEYESGSYSLWPGRAVAWLHYFQAAGIHQANRACWNVQVEGGANTSSCWATFNGLLDDTNRATQPLYWVHERYARMSQGGRWLVTEPFADVDLPNNHLAGVAAVAADMGSEVRLLVGNFGALDVTPIDIVVTGYPHLANGMATVTTERIAGIGGSTISRTARTPEAAVTSRISVAGRQLVIRLPSLKAGDAYAILIGP